MFLRYVILRLLTVVPTLLAIILLIFAFKAFIPDDFLERTLTESVTQQAGLSQEDLVKEILELRKDLQLDLPLFYFTIQSSILPDTLHKIYPIEKADFIRDILLEYGNRENAENYVLQVFELQRSGNFEARVLGNQLFGITSPEAIAGFLGPIQNTPIVESFKAMNKFKSTVSPLVPAFKWIGPSNQFHQWLSGLLSLDFGKSIVDQREVSIKIKTALINTLHITIPGLLGVLLICIPIGIWLSRLKGILRRVSTTILFALDALPLFWISLLLILFLASNQFINAFPAFGLTTVNADGLSLQYLVLPVLALIISAVGYVSMQVAKAINDEESKVYVLSARALGYSEKDVLWRHVFRNSLIPIITIISGFFISAFAGSLVVEIIFSIPGMGKLLYDSVSMRDFPVILGVLLVISTIKIIVNLLTDVSYKVINPTVNF
ncbi:MAG: ABC transporter permease [Cyclobacteriaceae bacterium]